MTTETLVMALNEKDVENTYRHNFLKKFKDMEISSPFGCDGFGVSKSSNVRVLMEYKDNLNLSNKLELVKVLAQSVFYVKKFYDKGIIPPSTIFIGDRNECLALHVNDIIKYLELELNWSTAPSSAHNIPELVMALMKDDNIKPFVYDSEHFAQCIDKIKDLTDNVQRKVLVTDKNITEVFRYFDEKVLGKVKLTTNEKANLFVQLLVNRDDNYLHPVSKRKMIVTKSFGEVAIASRDSFESFFAHFSSSYTPSQKHKLAAVVDRIVEDTTRRKQGEFFTPAIWVDKAHEYVASVFGEDWKEKYIVWDPAWGTGNLTRDYKFKELYVSTLNQSDIDTANQMGYNPEAVKFQYDFLNDDYSKLPEGLRNAIESGKEIIVLMNPPYATSTDMRNTSNEETMHKSGTSDTKTYSQMITNGFGKGSEQLYSQFIYKITEINVAHIAMFTKPLFISGPTFNIFRNKIINQYSFRSGFLMDSANFADVKSWGLTFTILEKKPNSENNFVFDVLELIDFEIHKTSKKSIYNTDNSKPLSEWIREEIKEYKGDKILLPHLSSGVKVVNKKVSKENAKNYLGSYIGLGNNVQRNDRGVTLLTSTGVQGNAKVSLSVSKENFNKMVVVFSSRKLIEPTWINEKDEYLTPSTTNEHFSQFTNDSLIYSLFNNSSEQSSLRQIEYKGQTWDIKNEFFWLSANKMKELADQNGYDELYNDARTSSDRYVYKLLFGEERIYDKLSPDAKLVLDKATELVEKSMELRQVMANDENHLNSWDAGYAQLKLVWKEYFQEDFKEFRQLYKNLEDRMRPLVYELGFLMK